MSLRQCQRYIIFSTVRLILTLDLFLMSCLNVNIVRQELIKMFHIPWSHMFDWDRDKVINLLYTFPESWAFLINVFRNELQCNRIPACSHKKNVLLCCDLLPPIWLVCCCLLDKVWFTNVLSLQSPQSSDQRPEIPECSPGQDRPWLFTISAFWLTPR